jgi:putative protease
MTNWSETMAKKIELLSPAGDLQRGKTALDFGADAIYTGAQNYSLRARASNFTYDNIEEICNYAHQLNKKVYVVSNVLCQNSMLGGYGEYLQKILSSKPDALIVSDPYIISQIRKVNKDIEIHISTQQSVSNSKAALFFARNKCNRIILSREVTFEELKQMIKNVEGKIDLEVFVHGAVCIAYSGRCMVSANFCLRDANIGGCAQSCR